MGIRNLFGKSRYSRKFGDQLKKLEAETMELDQLRDRVMSLIWYDKMRELHDLCDEQFIVAPVLVEKAIQEIVPGNKWNDVLFLMARKMIEVGPPHVAVYAGELQKKCPLVKYPNGGKEVMAPFVQFS